MIILFLSLTTKNGIIFSFECTFLLFFISHCICFNSFYSNSFHFISFHSTSIHMATHMPIFYILMLLRLIIDDTNIFILMAKFKFYRRENYRQYIEIIWREWWMICACAQYFLLQVVRWKHAYLEVKTSGLACSLSKWLTCSLLFHLKLNQSGNEEIVFIFYTFQSIACSQMNTLPYRLMQIRRKIINETRRK